jgi:hypothetical protein
MIATDTSTWIAFLEGEMGVDTEPLDQALRDWQLLVVPVLTELLSDRKLSVEVAKKRRQNERNLLIISCL